MELVFALSLYRKQFDCISVKLKYLDELTFTALENLIDSQVQYHVRLYKKVSHCKNMRVLLLWSKLGMLPNRISVMFLSFLCFRHELDSQAPTTTLRKVFVSVLRL